MAWKKIFSKLQDRGSKQDPDNAGFLIPEGAIRLRDLTIGGKSPGKLEKALDSEGFGITEAARSLLKSPEFITLPKKRTICLVKVTLKDLNLPDSTVEEVFARAEELGLEFCPPEVGPQLRLARHGSQWLFIGMAPIYTSNDHPYIFRLTEGNSTYNHEWLDCYSLLTHDHKLQKEDGWEFVFTFQS